MSRIWRLTFGLGIALAGFSGVMIAPLFAVDATMGELILVQTFIVVVVGGMGSFIGPVIGGLILGQLWALTPLVGQNPIRGSKLDGHGDRPRFLGKSVRHPALHRDGGNPSLETKRVVRPRRRFLIKDLLSSRERFLKWTLQLQKNRFTPREFWAWISEVLDNYGILILAGPPAGVTRFFSSAPSNDSIIWLEDNDWETSAEILTEIRGFVPSHAP